MPGREAEDRADVDVLALARRAPGPVVAPARERAEHGHQLARALGQLVVHARRHLAVALARQQAVGDHPVQPRAQLLGRDAGQHALQLDEPARAGGEVADDEQRPLVAHEIERAGVRRPLVVRVALGRWDGWDERPPLVRPWSARQNTRSTAEGCWYRHIAADDRDVITSASSRRLARCMAAKGAAALASGERHETRMYGMGDVIRLEDRRARRRPDAAAGDAVRAEFLFDLACPFTYLAAERVERAFDEVTWTPACARTLRCGSLPTRTDDVAARRRRRPRSAPRRCACRSSGPSAARCRVPAAMRVAALRRRAGPRRGVRARRDAARVLRRLRPRRPRDPRRGRGRRRHAARRLPARGAARSAATARSRRRRARCSARAPTGCRRCASARALFWGEDRVGEAAAAARLHAAAAGRLSRYGRDEPGEDLRVERLERLAPRRPGGALRIGSSRSASRSSSSRSASVNCGLGSGIVASYR